ncbi:Site-specific recombinase XerD [Lutibacter agarilyticus]|uniref:Site-specific recombinase XerD n=1 Tax=Lutibacter agarilyticus TaxID=1109740 RepID=A0A238WHI1_9FLAO|nr:site-specific integrase [Lutibacter agarilyticus]SNR46025.1 Site-specific recombinase XerD [Lutibacter agarilyticus]
MKKTFNIIFFIKKDRIPKNGDYNIFCRVRLGVQKFSFSTKITTKIENWDTTSNRVTGRNNVANKTNNELASVSSAINKIHDRFRIEEKAYTLNDIKNEYLGLNKRDHFLIETYSKHIEKVKSMLGKEYSISTWKKYKTTKTHLTNYLERNYNKEDISFKELDYNFIFEFDYYLQSNDIAQNSRGKYINNVKQLINIALSNDWITINPFRNFKVKITPPDREFLTSNELLEIYNKEFEIDRLEQIKDAFLFCCYTGLAYIDVKNLFIKDITIGEDGNKWIRKNRTKTNTLSRIPLLPIPENIIEKYNEHPLRTIKGHILPLPSNQKTNAYLKEIAAICKIKKNLTFHMARHTFATTITLTNGVPIETVSKMLGHKDLKTTQHYAKILDKKISNDMMDLKNKLG